MEELPRVPEVRRQHLHQGQRSCVGTPLIFGRRRAEPLLFRVSWAARSSWPHPRCLSLLPGHGPPAAPAPCSAAGAGGDTPWGLPRFSALCRPSPCQRVPLLDQGTQLKPMGRSTPRAVPRSAGPPSLRWIKLEAVKLYPWVRPGKGSLCFPSRLAFGFSPEQPLRASSGGFSGAGKGAEAWSWEFKWKGCHRETVVAAFPFSCTVKIKVEMGYTVTDI